MIHVIILWIKINPTGMHSRFSFSYILHISMKKFHVFVVGTVFFMQDKFFLQLHGNYLTASCTSLLSFVVLIISLGKTCVHQRGAALFNNQSRVLGPRYGSRVDLSRISISTLDRLGIINRRIHNYCNKE